MAGDAMPSHWRLGKLGDLGEVNRGRSRHRPRYAEHLYGGAYPFIQTGDIKNSGGLITTYQQTYSEAGLAQSQMWPAGTMCITIAANIGDTGILTFPACFPDSVVGFIADESKCDVRFVEYTFRHLRQQIQNEASGSVQDNINLATLERLRFPIPPLSEQRAIAHILGTLDDKIELNRRMSETLEAMARALFKSWFVDFDPVRAKAAGLDPGLPNHIADLFPSRLVDSELGEIPEGWEANPVYGIATYTNGAAYAAFEPNDARQGLPIIKIAELKAGVTAQTKFSDVQMPEKYRIVREDILFSWSGNPDTSIDTFVWAHGSGWLNQHIFRVLPHHHHERAYVLSTLKALRPTFAEIARNKQTTGLGHVTAEDMKRLLVARPDERVMKAWNTLVAPLHARVFQIQLESCELVTLRDTLLPKLISGELPLKNVARFIESDT